MFVTLSSTHNELVSYLKNGFVGTVRLVVFRPPVLCGCKNMFGSLSSTFTCPNPAMPRWSSLKHETAATTSNGPQYDLPKLILQYRVHDSAHLVLFLPIAWRMSLCLP